MKAVYYENGGKKLIINLNKLKIWFLGQQHQQHQRFNVFFYIQLVCY